MANDNRRFNLVSMLPTGAAAPGIPDLALLEQYFDG